MHIAKILFVTLQICFVLEACNAVKVTMDVCYMQPEKEGAYECFRVEGTICRIDKKMEKYDELVVDLEKCQNINSSYTLTPKEIIENVFIGSLFSPSDRYYLYNLRCKENIEFPEWTEAFYKYHLHTKLEHGSNETKITFRRTIN